ncbi:MAG: zincin-like metallopeptidase domain-containing protein, partial [Fuerstiella sp.]
MASSRKPDVYSMVTDRVVELLERGTVPWRKPWKGKNLHPCNAKTGHQYRGLNPFMLEIVRACSGYQDHRWLTYKQAQAAGGNIRKGEKSSFVTFWQWLEVIDKETQKPKKIPLLKYFRVFNIEQTENIDEGKLRAESDVYESTEWESIVGAEAITDGWLQRSGLAERIQHGGNRAFYRPADDSLQMPDQDRFGSAAEYHQTLFHELGHSTGHKSRLNRLSPDGFGSDPYAKEELIAELTASFLAGQCGLTAETEQNSTAYIAGWLRVLKQDKKLVGSS